MHAERLLPLSCGHEWRKLHAGGALYSADCTVAGCLALLFCLAFQLVAAAAPCFDHAVGAWYLWLLFQACILLMESSQRYVG
jgi:hypothetical protein